MKSAHRIRFILPFLVLLATTTAFGVPSPPTKVMPLLGEARDEFGFSISLSSNTLLVGAPRRNERGLDSGAAYVFQQQAGAWTEVTKLSPADVVADDSFGFAVAVSGDTAIVGSRGDDDGGSSAGSAYMFHRDQGGAQNWGQVTKLFASDPAQFDQFSYSVAISGDTAVVGAFAKDGNGGDRSGAAYVFERNFGGPNVWGQMAKLTPSNATGYDLFGYSVAISDDAIIVGAPADDNFGPKIGAAFVYQRDGSHPGGWRESLKITPTDSSPLNKFGGSVSISGQTALIGANWDNDNGFRSGAAYVFEQDNLNLDNWSQTAKLTPVDGVAEDWFGVSVALSGDAAVVGSWQDDDQGASSGSAYIFQRGAGGPNNWGQTTKAIGTDTAAFNHFGYSIAVSGSTGIAGAYGGGQSGNGAGKAYAFFVPEPSTVILFASGLVSIAVCCLHRK